MEKRQSTMIERTRIVTTKSPAILPLPDSLGFFSVSRSLSEMELFR